MATCPQCHANIPDGSANCPQCGAVIGAPQGAGLPRSRRLTTRFLEGISSRPCISSPR